LPDYETSQPFIENVSDNERDLVLPAINGVKEMLFAAAQEPSIRQVVITSSLAAVIDLNRQGRYVYTASDWNSMSYAEAINPKTDAFAVIGKARNLLSLLLGSLCEVIGLNPYLSWWPSAGL
jgi:hypothetical protein